jgi:hypothetical protein
MLDLLWGDLGSNGRGMKDGSLLGRLGDLETISRAAKTALSLAKRALSFPAIPTLGLAIPDPSTLAWLEKASQMN